MPKTGKTHKGILKRMKLTAKGKIVRKRPGKGHLLSGKTGAHKSRLNRVGKVHSTQVKTYTRLMTGV